MQQALASSTALTPPRDDEAPQKSDAELAAEFLADCVDDPLLFVYGVFAWGEGQLKPTTSDPSPGPDAWQIHILELIHKKHLTLEQALRVAVASGHGIGKSALIAWIVLWFHFCKPMGAGIVTANTGKQLSGKTWREIGVWLERMREVYRRDRVITATKLYQVDHELTWFIAAVEWNEKKPAAFQGLHAEWVLVVMDEGSEIPTNICEAVSGAMTTPHAIWVIFGNPTKNTGYFYECFHRFRNRWHTIQVDSRAAKMTNKQELEGMIADYGIDSDYCRVRIRGVFPRAGSVQFIANDNVEESFAGWRKLGKLTMNRNHPIFFGPLVLGVDVARFGDDASCIWARRGNYARRLARYRGADTQDLASYIAEFIDELDPDMVFVDGTGLGAGVVDRLRKLGYGARTYEVINSGKAKNDKKYKNVRAECWGGMRDAVKAGLMIEPMQEVMDDLTGPEYFFDGQQRIQLEAKDDMKRRGLASPDNGDALANTFASPVAAREPDDPEQDRYGSKDRGGSAWAA
jgi:hypothetical protein